MIKVEHIDVYNFENALRGMRNPLESWDKSDSKMILDINEQRFYYSIGPNDMELALKLVKAGSDHSKFMRQIFVSMDITAPMSCWWDLDTYKVATAKNSTSRMHKLGSRLLTPEDFSWDDEDGQIVITPFRHLVLGYLNREIEEYQRLKKINSKDAIAVWRRIVLDLPDGYNFLATWTGSYENMRNIYHARNNHKTKELRDFCKIIETLPHSKLITIERKK